MGTFIILKCLTVHECETASAWSLFIIHSFKSLSFLKFSPRPIAFTHLYLLSLISLFWDCVFDRLKYNFVFCIVTVKCCVSLQSDCAVLLLCCACLLDYLFSFSLFSVLTVCSGPALGNTRSYKLLDWNSVTAGIFPPFYCSHPKEWWQLSEVQPLNNNDLTLSQCTPARLHPQNLTLACKYVTNSVSCHSPLSYLCGCLLSWI